MRSIWDRLAGLLCLSVVLAAFLVGKLVYENLPHLEDEFAYLWQARVMADGYLTLPSPDFPKSFVIPFVVDHQGLRFAKYPPGWPAALSLGVRVGLSSWVNPLLAGLAVWLTYQLGKRTLDEVAGFLGALLLGTSPMFLIQSGSLLSHIWSLVLTVSFALFWIDSLGGQEGRGVKAPTVLAGLCLGLLGLTRPLTALAVCLPFALEGSVVLIKGPKWKRQRVLVTGGISVLLLGLYPIWQQAVTGSFQTNPYTLWWSYDRYGFGPGFGVTEAGHSLLQGWRNTRYSLRVAASDLFGWPKTSWLFLPVGIWASRRSRLTLYSLGITICLIGLYLGYWVGSWLLGPRYYIEALPGLALLSGAGIAWLGQWQAPASSRVREGTAVFRLRPALVAAGLGLLLFANLYLYLPSRLSGLFGLYGIEKQDLVPFETPAVQAYQPALVIVDSERWMPYGSTLVLESPELDSPFIFAWGMGERTDELLAERYREERNVLYYYPDRDPYTLFTYPQPGSLIE
ncbi:MAG: STT3 domain-containing protein [Anaerolineales bacterium]